MYFVFAKSRAKRPCRLSRNPSPPPEKKGRTMIRTEKAGKINKKRKQRNTGSRGNTDAHLRGFAGLSPRRQSTTHVSRWNPSTCGPRGRCFSSVNTSCEANPHLLDGSYKLATQESRRAGFPSSHYGSWFVLQILLEGLNGYFVYGIDRRKNRRVHHRHPEISYISLYSRKIIV